MIQKIYEFLLFHSIDHLKFYNFLCDTFPTLEKRCIEKEEAKINKLYIPQEDLDRMGHNVWQRLCNIYPELDRSKF